MTKIKIAIVGLGNCASALIQGIHYYRGKKASDAIGLMHWNLGGFAPGDIQVVAAFDIDRRKVGRDVSEAIFAKPNCTKVFCPNIRKSGVKVRMGRILDGVAEHMKNYDPDLVFPAFHGQGGRRTTAWCAVLKESGAEVLMNYLPVGSEKAVKFYAQCALDAGVGLINNMPVFIASASSGEWAGRLRRARPAHHRRRHQVAAGGHHHPPRAGQAVHRPRRQDRAHLPAQHRRQHRFPEHARPDPAEEQAHIQDQRRDVGPGAAAGQPATSTSAPATISPG